MKRALVTLAIEERYLGPWREFARAGWEEYARRFDLDLIEITEPIDRSARAGLRSPAWQKCLIPNQPWAAQYDRILWVDSDIVVNTAGAGDLLSEVPAEKVGALVDASQPFFITPGWRRVYHPHYYTEWGLPSDWGSGMNTGVLTITPRLHAELFQYVYDNYEGRPGPEWHYEQRPLAWHLFDAGLVYPIDSRYNFGWARDRFLHYPFLLPERPDYAELARLCMQSSLSRAYFLHFAGCHGDMQYLST
ncbi:MAG: hypothetical protein ACK6DY_24220 [Acidobacteriota bacterium]|jgi:hypothetical protein